MSLHAHIFMGDVTPLTACIIHAGRDFHSGYICRMRGNNLLPAHLHVHILFVLYL